ncbi:UDP-N-acetyl glucosamine 2-epimerase [bacterium]|nr:UDP-N-acetyl glucosamine 2-epimerase [bacterium]
MLKLVHIVGARPQFIKLAPLCRAIKGYEDSVSNGIPLKSIIIHTGQHYDYCMSKVFFDDLQIPAPDFNLEVGSGRHGEQTGLMLSRIEDVLIKERPDTVIVYGDTNSTLAGALAASKLHIPIIHIEAGLRSYNRKMPEEINRVLTDHISAILICPTKTAVENLKKEGFTNILKKGELIDPRDDFPISEDNPPVVVNTGDIMYESVLFSLNRAIGKSMILKKLNLEQVQDEITPYALCTIHRQENTDDLQRLEVILRTLDEISGNEMAVVFPVHPRTKKRIDSLGNCVSSIRLIDPVSYYDMLLLQKHSRIIFTDSGGIQKEAFFMRVPCITLRDETEWVETVNAGMNIVTGIDKKTIVEAFHRMLRDPSKRLEDKCGERPFGNADSSRLILNLILGAADITLK